MYSHSGVTVYVVCKYIIVYHSVIIRMYDSYYQELLIFPVLNNLVNPFRPRRSIYVNKVNKRCHNWLTWVFACLSSTHLLNQCWFMVNQILSNKLPWNFNHDSIFFQRKSIENVVCKMAAILFKPHYLNLFICQIQNHMIFALSCIQDRFQVCAQPMRDVVKK